MDPAQEHVALEQSFELYRLASPPHCVWQSSTHALPQFELFSLFLADDTAHLAAADEQSPGVATAGQAARHSQSLPVSDPVHMQSAPPMSQSDPSGATYTNKMNHRTDAGCVFVRHGKRTLHSLQCLPASAAEASCGSGRGRREGGRGGRWCVSHRNHGHKSTQQSKPIDSMQKNLGCATGLNIVKCPGAEVKLGFLAEAGSEYMDCAKHTQMGMYYITNQSIAWLNTEGKKGTHRARSASANFTCPACGFADTCVTGFTVPAIRVHRTASCMSKRATQAD